MNEKELLKTEVLKNLKLLSENAKLRTKLKKEKEKINILYRTLGVITKGNNNVL